MERAPRLRIVGRHGAVVTLMDRVIIAQLVL
jgi:hypothetical protein